MKLISTKNLLLLSIPLYIIHAIEEYSTGILKLDPLFRWIEANHLPTFTVYVAEQILLELLLLWAIYRPKRWILVFIGLIFIFEVSHIIPALQKMSYYPGLISAILLVALGWLYWKKLIQIKIFNFSRNKPY